MGEIAEIILRSGRSGVEVALFIFLPVMVVMLTLMRMLEARGVMDWIVKWAQPILSPFGLPGLGIFALIQVLFVSFAAPMATLAIMDKGGTPRRHIAATLAMVLGTAQANVTFPMAAVGLNAPKVMLISLVSGILGAALTYHLFARNLPLREDENQMEVQHGNADDVKGVLAVINKAGAEAFTIAISAIPMLILALVCVNTMRETGFMTWLEGLLAPLFVYLNIPETMALPIITKYIAGGTAMMGVTLDFLKQGLIQIDDFNRLAGFMINPYDIAGVAILISAGKRVAEVLIPALLGGACAILLRTFLHAVL